MKEYKYIEKIQMYGSRVICSPPPTDTDEDYIIYSENLAELLRELENDGFKSDSDDIYEGSEFISLRKGNTNYVLTKNIKFYEATIKATEIAKELNLLSKQDRISLFKLVQHSFGFSL